MSTKISTKVLPGFMELLPAEQRLFDAMKQSIQASYESFGFMAIDTPAIERAEALLAKAGGETEKQIYQFSKGDNELALRFDLTVPLARYVSDHYNDLVFPFRRYHIAKVYRGEKPQKGRFREFYQCDIDIIGHNNLSLINDAEILAVIYDVFSNLQLPRFMVRISNRKLISGLLESFSLSEKATDVMRVIDKIEKIGAAKVRAELSALGLSTDSSDKILDFVAIKGAPNEVLAALEALQINSSVFAAGLAELKTVIAGVKSFALPETSYGLDLSIARGLDYYTGTVYETVLLDYEQIGSICSGGRYDNLADTYSSQKLPGVGISIGLTRLFSQLLELGLIKTQAASPARVLIIPLDEVAIASALNTGRSLRSHKIATEIYFEEAKLKTKLTYASRLGIRYVVLIGADEIVGNFLTVKDMESGQQSQLNTDTLIAQLS